MSTKKGAWRILCALTLAAAAACGQSKTLTAKIPFAFRAVGSDLPAGQYTISQIQGATGALVNMELRNIDNGKAVLIPTKTAPLSESGTGRARLVFRCGAQEGCSLATLWSGNGSGLEFSTPAPTASQKERLETIYLDRFKGK
jgi:hypothetical protein